MLIDDEWLDCFEAHNISVAISLDGPAHIHDIHRRTFQGTGTHAAVERAARLLVSRDIGVSALAVCNPSYPPKQYVDFFAECGIASYDIMIPDATIDEHPPSVAAFYNGLFALWLEANRSAPTVNIRIVSDMITALLGNNSPTEGVGYKPVELCTVMTDGSVEAHDVLRIAGDGYTQTTFNIFEHAIDEVRNEPRWKAARDASINLCEKCRGMQVHERLRRRLSSASLLNKTTITTIPPCIAMTSTQCSRIWNQCSIGISISASPTGGGSMYARPWRVRS